MNINYLIILSLLLIPLSIAEAQEQQESQSEEAVEQAPRIIQEPAYEYFYWPEEDLNNFGLSTMGEGKSGSTLGNTPERTSNIEANEFLRSKKEAKKKVEAQDDNKPKTLGAGEQKEPDYQAPEQISTRAPSDNPIYEWRDEDGNLHMTNELGKVPPEYQDQFFEDQTKVPGQ